MKKKYYKPSVEYVSFEMDEELLAIETERSDMSGGLGEGGDLPEGWE